MADAGTSFDTALDNVSLCCPSRSTILSGQYAHNHGVLGNKPPTGGFERFHALGHEADTVAVWLHAAGYHTALLGKYLNGYPDDKAKTFVPPGWDEWASPAGGTPYGNFDYTLNEDGRLVTYGSAASDYLTDVLARKAVATIDRAVAEDRPLFLYLATYAPHSPATPAPRHAGAFAGTKAPRSASFNEADVSDKPDWVRRRDVLGTRDTQQIDALFQKRLESMLAVEEALEQVLAALERTGRLASTYVFFTSDNGFHMGQHRLDSGKLTAYDEDIRIPLIVRGPGVPAGRHLAHLVGNVDFAPTFAALAGVTVPASVDGRSLVPLLGASPPPMSEWRQAFLVEHPTEEDGSATASATGALEPADPLEVGIASGGASAAIPSYQALRTADSLYVEYGTGERELYDLRSDPDELRSLAASESTRDVARLSSWLAALVRCAGAECRAADLAPR